MEKIEYNRAYKKYCEIEKILNKKKYKFQLTGSMRREKKYVGDIDIIIEGETKEIYNYIYKELGIDNIDKDGKFEIEKGIIVQLIIVLEKEYNYNLWTSTGSKSHVKKIIDIYKERKIEIPDNEQEIYNKIGLCFIKPEERE